MHNEMPGFFPGRPGGEPDEPLLDMILERCPIPPGAPPEIHGLARMLAAVAGPAEPGDLPGQAAALAAFSRLVPPPVISPSAPRSARRSLSRRPARGRLSLAVALTAAAVGLGGAAAANVEVVPGPIQHFARVALGAPAPVPAPARAFTQHGPAVTSSPTHKQPELSPPAPGKIYSAASADPVSDKTRPGPFRHHLRMGNGAGPGYYRCVPTPAFEQGPAVGRSRNPAWAGLRCRRPGRTASSR
jgi:hypothetical protein